MLERRSRPAAPCPICGEDLRQGSRRWHPDLLGMVRKCRECDFADAGSISKRIWAPQRWVRIASSHAILTIVMAAAVTTSLIPLAIPSGSRLISAETAGQIALGLLAGGILRVLVPYANILALTIFWASLFVGGILIVAWLEILIPSNMVAQIPPSPRPTFLEFVDLAVVKVLPAVAAFLASVMVADCGLRWFRHALKRQDARASSHEYN